MLWTLKNLMEWASHNSTQINEKWVPVRPLRPYGLWGLRVRLRAAWMVLTDRAEAFTWPEGQ